MVFGSRDRQTDAHADCTGRAISQVLHLLNPIRMAPVHFPLHYSTCLTCVTLPWFGPLLDIVHGFPWWLSDAFELWCWRRLLRVPWTARRSSQSILKEISPEYSLEGLLLKLKLQYFGCLMLSHWKRPWCWERLRAVRRARGKGSVRR